MELERKNCKKNGHLIFWSSYSHAFHHSQKIFFWNRTSKFIDIYEYSQSLKLVVHFNIDGILNCIRFQTKMLTITKHTFRLNLESYLLLMDDRVVCFLCQLVFEVECELMVFRSWNQMISNSWHYSVFHKSILSS